MRPRKLLGEVDCLAKEGKERAYHFLPFIDLVYFPFLFFFRAFISISISVIFFFSLTQPLSPIHPPLRQLHGLSLSLHDMLRDWDNSYYQLRANIEARDVCR